jgi:hypothetical protein
MNMETCDSPPEMLDLRFARMNAVANEVPTERNSLPENGLIRHDGDWEGRPMAGFEGSNPPVPFPGPSTGVNHEYESL